ncbi:MAG: SDR family oxidoreductase [Haloarculaceae archaeon]
MSERTVVVTGGTRGIGAAVARALVENSTHVVTCARDSDALDALADDLVDAPGRVTTQRADVRDEYDVERLLETAARAGDGVDAVVANAGVYHGDPGDTPLDEDAYAAFDDHYRTNARGVFATFREAVPHLTDDARLLALSGRVAREPQAGFGSYAVSKAATEAVARQFAADLDVPVGVVDPGTVATDLTGDKGMDPERAAPLVVWALSEADPDTLDGAVVDRRTMRQG